jgi:anti-sigma regulatory factor (Ser/Thr protein kinase)
LFGRRVLCRPSGGRSVEGKDGSTQTGRVVRRRPPSGRPVPPPAGPCPSPPVPRRRHLTAERLSLRLPATLAAPSEARRAVLAALPDVPGEVLAEMELLVTELVTNAVRHGGLGEGDVIELRVMQRGSAIRVEVAEGGPGFDPAAALVPDPEAIGGWGLLLVSRMASRWGVTRGRPNVAWFEMDLPATLG